MNHKELQKELDADIRNKLCFPKTLLELLKDGRQVKKQDIKKAIKDIDKAVTLTKKWFEESDKEV